MKTHCMMLGTMVLAAIAGGDALAGGGRNHVLVGGILQRDGATQIVHPNKTSNLSQKNLSKVVRLYRGDNNTLRVVNESQNLDKTIHAIKEKFRGKFPIFSGSDLGMLYNLIHLSSPNGHDIASEEWASAWIETAEDADHYIKQHK